MNVSQIIESFDLIVKSSQFLSESLDSHQNPLWLPLTPNEVELGVSPLKKAQNFYQDFWYQNGQDGRETRSCFGLISANEEQIQKAIEINEHKETFKKQVKLFQTQNKQAWNEFKGQLAQRHSHLRDSLHLSGLTRLHLKQTWRCIPVIERTPSRVGFNWYNSGRSIQKITVEQAQQALLNLDQSSDHIQTQLSVLSHLPPHTPLAKVQNLAPTMRANLFYQDDALPNRQAMNISLPILFKAGPENKLPSHNEPSLTAPTTRQRAIRSDRKIEDEPFLPSIRVHRYINH
jgi:hypothetical protein